MLKRLIVFLVLFLVGISPLRAEEPPLLGSLFCPPAPSLKDGVCAPKCPEGYKPFSDVENGIFACIPSEINNPGDTDKKCYYYDPDCDVYSVNQVVEKTFAKGLSQFWNQKEPFINLLVKVASFDLEGLKNFGTLSDNPKFKFITQVVRELSDSMITLFFKALFISLTGITAIVGAYLIPKHLSFLSVDAKDRIARHLESRFPELQVPVVLFTRGLFAFALVFTPVGVVDHNGQREYITAVQKVVEEVSLLGSKVANETSRVISKDFLVYSAQILKSMAQDEFSINKKMVEEAQKNLQNAYERAKKCVEIYGKVDLTQIPDDELYKIPVYDPEGAKVFSRRYCKHLEAEYKWTLERYALLYKAYRKSDDFKKWLEENDLSTSAVSLAEKLDKEDAYVSFTAKTVRDKRKVATLSMAIVVKTVRDYGWFSLPIVLFPAMDTLSVSDDFVKQISAYISSPSPDNGIVVKAIAFLSFPPGVWIFQNLMKLGMGVVNVLGSSTAVFSKVPIVGSFLGSLSAGVIEALGSMAVFVSTILASALMASVILKVLPTLFLGVIVALRTFFWLLDVSKSIIISPLSVLLALSHHASRFWGFIASLLILGLYPLLILSSALLAYFGASILADTAFYIPLNAIFSYLGKVGYFDVLQFGVSKYKEVSVGGTPFYYLVVAVLYYVNVILKVFIIWSIGMNGPEKFLQMLRIQEIAPQHPEIREIAESAKRPVSPI